MPKTSMWRPWSDVAGTGNPLQIVKGFGCRVQDATGRWYLDGVAGALNASCGHGHGQLIEAASRQMAELVHYDLTTATHPMAETLAERIAALLPGDLDQVLFLNSGSEATEAALWIALQYWHNVSEPRTRVVSLERSYHGATFVARHLSGLPVTHSDWIAPFPVDRVALPVSPRRLRTPTGARALLESFRRELSVGDPVAAVIIEPLLNLGGGVVLPEGFLGELRELCYAHGTLLVLDEVFCGFGRTGRMFGFEHSAIVPDIVTMSKGISSGYVPLSAVATTQRIKDSFTAEPVIQGLRYGHTTGGHAVACAVGHAVLDVLEADNLIENAALRGADFAERLAVLEDSPTVYDVRGLGLVHTVETADEANAATVVGAARELGLLVRSQGPNVMVVPPLTLSAEDAGEMADLLIKSFRQSTAGYARAAR